MLRHSFDRPQQTQCIQELLEIMHSRRDTYHSLFNLSLHACPVFVNTQSCIFSVQGLTQGCRAEAEKVLQQATRAGLGGSKPLQAWKDSQVSQVTPEACDLHSILCMMLHMLYMPLHALNIAQYVC